MKKRILKAKIIPSQIAKEIEDFIVSQVINAGAMGGIIGLSGGIDSTTVAYLAKRAFIQYNMENWKAPRLELYGLILPAGKLNYEDTQEAISIADTLNIVYKIIDIEPILETRKKVNTEVFNKKYHYGNAAARERMIQLYGEAADKNFLVLGTGNKDEDSNIGYFTKYGDGGVDISPIGNLPKRLVRILATHIEIPDKIINKDPSARLWAGQTDETELGYTYDQVETVLKGFEQNYAREEIHKMTGFSYTIIDSIKDRHIRNRHKMSMPPVAEISLNYRDFEEERE